MKPGPGGAFRAKCKRLREDHEANPTVKGSHCADVFETFAEFEAHMKAVHPTRYRQQKLTAPDMGGPRKKPFGLPAVKPENQRVTPGAHFEHNGRPCQVIGQISAKNVRFLAWLEHGQSPNNKTAVCHGADGDSILWEMVGPVDTVVAAVQASEAS